MNSFSESFEVENHVSDQLLSQLLSHQKSVEKKSEPWGAKCRAMFFALDALMGRLVTVYDLGSANGEACRSCKHNLMAAIRNVP